jgi:IS30 family transposase
MGHYSQFNLHERKVIQKRLWQNTKHSIIAEELHRHTSSIIREVQRNKCEDGFYRAIYAHKKATRRHIRKGVSKIQRNENLMLYILEKLLLRWSPEYIAGRLQYDFPEDHSMRISYESIYQWIYGLYFTEGITLWMYLPRKRRIRKKRQCKLDTRLKITGKKNIKDRPAVVATREEFGHWEGDTVVGKNNDGYIVTLLERATQVYLTAPMQDKKGETCVKAIAEAFGDIQNEFIKTITFDNGTEFSCFKSVEELFECEVYFADPYSSWQRGSNERSNGLLRRFFPKGTSFKDMDEKELAIVVKRINTMPRKMLNFLTPYEVFFNNSIALQN